MNAFWPGPFTIILERTSIVPNTVTGGLNTVGVRMPSNKIAHELIKYAGVPIAAPSANISTRPSGTNLDDIKEEFTGLVDLAIDGGSSQIGLESTVVKVVDNVPVILRPGFITKEDIEMITSKCLVSEHVLKQIDSKTKVESPGMLYRHYAPKTKCLLVYSANLDTLKELVTENTFSKTIVLGSSKLKDIPCFKYIFYGNTKEEISHNIFSLLRKCDTYNADLIIIEGVKKEGLGLAIMNRLIRTSNFNYIEK